MCVKITGRTMKWLALQRLHNRFLKLLGQDILQGWRAIQQQHMKLFTELCKNQNYKSSLIMFNCQASDWGWIEHTLNSRWSPNRDRSFSSSSLFNCLQEKLSHANINWMNCELLEGLGDISKGRQHDACRICSLGKNVRFCGWKIWMH